MRPESLRTGFAGLVLLASIFAFPPLAAASDWTWVVEGGAFDVQDDPVPFLGIEARHRPRFWGIFPLVGVFATADESIHVRAGFGRDFPLGERVVMTLSSAAGYWEQGDGPDLGHELEFRSALDLHFRVRENLRVGLTVAHLSNAGIADHNPGVETVSVSLAWRP